MSYPKAELEQDTLLSDDRSNSQEDIAELLTATGTEINIKSRKPIDTPLHFAVINGDIDIVKALLEDRGADIDAKNQQGRTPLYNAVQHKKAEIAKLLLANGADPNNRDNKNISPLHLAIEKKHLKIIKHLLKYGAYINCEDCLLGDIRWSPLHVAARYYDENIVTLLLKYGADINIRGENNITPLHFVSDKGYENAVVFFLNKGADINACTNEKVTSLHLAAAKGHASVVKLLLNYGANVDDENDYGRTVLYDAVERGRRSIVQEVLKYCPDVNNRINRKCLQAAILYGRGKENKIIVEALLEYGFRISSSDAHNFKLLDAAIKKGYLKIVESLLTYNADANNMYHSVHAKGSTPLHVAVQAQREKVAKLLILHGANINAEDHSEKTPIFYAIDNADVRMTNLLLTKGANVMKYPELLSKAVKKNCIEIVQILLHYDIDIDNTDEFGRTALHSSVLGKRDFFFKNLSIEDQDLNVEAEIAQLLLRRGAYVDAETEEGMTALHIAVAKGSTKIVKILLEYDADVNYKMTDGIRPLHIAARGGFHEITEILLRFGADINSKDGFGESALHIATQMNHEYVIKTLLDYDSDFNDVIDLRLEILLPDSSSDDSSDENNDDSNNSDEGERDENENNEDDDSFDNGRVHHIAEEVVELFKQHIIKLQTANLRTDIPNLQCINVNGMNDFKDECNKELANMKLKKIDAKNSFYEILTKNINSLIKYMNNQNTVQILRSEEYEAEFPIFAGMIRSKFIRIMNRKILETKGRMIFYRLCNNSPGLPYECIEKIVNSLDEKSIKFLILACHSPNISNLNQKAQ